MVFNMPNLKVTIPEAKNPKVPLPRVTLPRPAPPTPRNVPGEGDWERITPETRAKVWKKRFGFRSTGICVCCHETAIHRDDFACGRRRAYASGGGNDASNLEPICGRCSEKLGTQDLVPWCRKFQEVLKTVKPMPKTTTAKKTTKAAAKKPAKAAAAKKTVRKTTAKRPVAKAAAAKKTVRKTAPKKTASKKAKR